MLESTRGEFGQKLLLFHCHKLVFATLCTIIKTVFYHIFPLTDSNIGQNNFNYIANIAIGEYKDARWNNFWSKLHLHASLFQFIFTIRRDLQMVGFVQTKARNLDILQF